MFRDSISMQIIFNGFSIFFGFMSFIFQGDKAGLSGQNSFTYNSNTNIWPWWTSYFDKHFC